MNDHIDSGAYLGAQGFEFAPQGFAFAEHGLALAAQGFSLAAQGLAAAHGFSFAEHGLDAAEQGFAYATPGAAATTSPPIATAEPSISIDFLRLRMDFPSRIHLVRRCLRRTPSLCCSEGKQKRLRSILIDAR
jgi:hypothetical protein